MKINELLSKSPTFFENKVAKKREYIVTKLEIKPTVFKNMNGFIKFRFSKDPFERTRINKECKIYFYNWGETNIPSFPFLKIDYKIAKKICKESIDAY